MQNINESVIFIVDDDIFKCHIIQKHLNNLGFHKISVFHDGMDCINNLSKNPEIILLDHEMHEVSGFETLKKIKRFNPNAFVIMVSAQEDMNTTIAAMKYGAFDYIIKGDDELNKIEMSLSRISDFQDKLNRRPISYIKKIFSVK